MTAHTHVNSQFSLNFSITVMQAKLTMETLPKVSSYESSHNGHLEYNLSSLACESCIHVHAIARGDSIALSE